MTLRTCPHEAEIKALMERGHWPHACAPELRTHTENCHSCRDLVLVTLAFRQASAITAKAAVLPPPGILWWRAQMRRRNAAIERIARPILGAQVFALCLYGLIAVGLFASQARHGLDWLSWFSGLTQSSTFRLDVLLPAVTVQTLASWPVLVPGIAMLALLSGVVVYLATERQ